jgi:hypothetical protein
MSVGYTEWYFQLFNTRTRQAIDDDAGICNVLTVDSPAEATIYSDQNGTSASNPMTFTNGVIRFWTTSSVTSLDLSVLTNTGHSFFLESVGPSQHRIDVDPDRWLYKLVIPYTYSGASETVVNSGYTISAAMLVKDIELDVVTAMTGGILAVGTSTDPDGFCDDVSAATTGFPATVLEEALVSTSSLFGALLANVTGPYVRKKYYRANATSGASIVYANGTSSSTAGAGYIYLTYDRLPTRQA